MKKMNIATATFHLTEAQIKTEEQEIRAAKADMSNFATIYNRYYVRIFRFIWQRVEEEDLAADLCSQVFIKAMQNLSKYMFRGLPFGSWLFRIARNEVNMHFRSIKKVRDIYATSDGISDIIDELVDDNTQELLDKMVGALDNLDEEEIEMVEMRFFEKRSFAQIGEIMDITENNAKVKVFRILKKLKKSFE